jgi:hypothetical protein
MRGGGRGCEAADVGGVWQVGHKQWIDEERRVGNWKKILYSTQILFERVCLYGV